MPPLRTILDDEFDEVGRLTFKGLGVRLPTAALTAVLLGVVSGPAVATIWLAALLAVEVWGLAITRGLAAGGPHTLAWRAQLAMAGLVAVSLWTATALVYWQTGVLGYRVVALLSLATMLIAGPPGSARSLPMLVITSAPPLLALASLPFLTRFDGLPLFMIALSVAMIAMHLAMGASIHRQAEARLEQARREAEAASRAKSSFLAMMSHEIRTPMNGVLGMAHALSQGALNDEQRRQLELLTRSGDGLMTILNDILDLSKIEAGKLELEEIVFDLHDLADQARAMWTASASAKGLTLAVSVDPSVPHWVSGDPTRVRQVLLNLVSNAVKFTEHGAIDVSLAAAGDDTVEIVVSDTGIGLTLEQRDGLFRAFAQADSSITRRFGGTGLGLSISRQLAALMGGDINVESEPGQGTVFRITLRLPAANPPAALEADHGLRGLAGLRVLVAEDNLVNQAVVQAVLGATGAIVDVADDGAAALRRLRERDYDLVLMDIHMPVMDGIEALRRIRNGEAGPPGRPVIALTADAMAGSEARFLALGFDAVESKPIRPAQLIAVIAEICAAADVGPADERLTA